MVCPPDAKTNEVKKVGNFSEAVELAVALENEKIKKQQGSEKENKELARLCRRLQEQQKILQSTKLEIENCQKIIEYIKKNNLKIDQLLLEARDEGKKTIKIKIED